jgi:hypothetical protein
MLKRQQDLGSLRKVELKILKKYDQEIFACRTRLKVEKLWFRTSIVITTRTRCKSKTNNFLQNFGSTTPMHERYPSLKKAQTSKASLKSIQGSGLGPF